MLYNIVSSILIQPFEIHTELIIALQTIYTDRQNTLKPVLDWKSIKIVLKIILKEDKGTLSVPFAPQNIKTVICKAPILAHLCR